MGEFGTHLLVDIQGATNLDDTRSIERALRAAAAAAGATVLHGHFHPFSPQLGVSGVLVLAESHITIHTWPDRAFAAIDVYMCGACDPRDTLAVFAEHFGGDAVVRKFRRGVAAAAEA